MIRISNIVKEYHVHGNTNRVLDGVSFDVGATERTAVLGKNGAGKSTLVRLVGGVEYPTSGVIDRQMSLSWPLGLAGGFHGYLSGTDTMKFISRIYQKDFEEVRDFVMDFSDLGRAINDPVKTYSSGMTARLAFGLSLAIDFDCYLVDEVIFVGDQNFHAKCRYELFEKNPDRSLFLVTHDHGIINEYCNSAVVLHKGRAKKFEDVEIATEIYNVL